MSLKQEWVASPENGSDSDTTNDNLNNIMRTWVHDTIEGFQHLFQFLFFAMGLDLIAKELRKEDELKPK